ncbi:S8 family serine peptidase [Kribbella deserti]|uniref:S8 family serine peptidase n=1 Tax=Kribbella deserti TaxID=1926257 RepID=A0ABV6QZ93_9ACTN
MRLPRLATGLLASVLAVTLAIPPASATAAAAVGASRQPVADPKANGSVTASFTRVLSGPRTAGAAAISAGGSGAGSGTGTTGTSGGRPTPGAVSKRVTLITGDVAELTIFPGGKRGARLLDPKAPYYLGEYDGDVHLVPAAAYPYLTAKRLDERLFNLSELVAQGYDDASTKVLPLLLSGPMPMATTKRFSLGSMVAVSTEKSRAREFWNSLNSVRTLSSGTGKVWLDGKVKALLDRSTAQIGAPTAWRKGYDGKGVKVAVLDTGYDPTHPDLKGKVSASKSFVPDETVRDGQGHGTHVATTVAGTGQASGGRRKGVAPGANLVVGKVLDNWGSGYDSWIIAGMEWAVAQGAKVVSISLGSMPSDGTDPMSETVNQLSARTGALFVIAAGNSGAEETVSSPAAATSALAVGAVDRDDKLAGFSSRGPRLIDGAIKPEVTAPGVDIVAGRAAGTNLGHDVGQYYTAMSGTSMATPHVAGAAAILAQHHPDWTGAQLKAVLAGTAKPSRNVSVTGQGTGRIDLAAALDPRVLPDQAALSFDADHLTRTIAYRNTSRSTVHLDLRLDVASPSGVKAAVSVSPNRLTIKPGAVGKAVVRLDQAKTSAGNYAGVLVAGGKIRTAIGFVAAGKLHDLTVSGTDRLGRPAQAVSGVQLWNTATGRVQTIAFDETGSRTLQVPTGRYAVMAFVMTRDDAGWDKSIALMGQPDVWVSKSMRLHFDARQTERVSIATPRRADPEGFVLAWHRAVGARTALSGWSMSPRITSEVYVQRFDRVRTGAFQVTQRWDLAEPQLTVDVLGTGGFRLLTPDQSGFDKRYVGSERLALVDAGDASAAELAKIDAKGKVALVRWRDYNDTIAQVEAVAKAGAKAVLMYKNEPGFWGDGGVAPIPVYALRQAEGLRLKALRGATLQLTGVAESTYRYDLALSNDRVNGPLRYDAGRLATAAIRTAFHQHEGWQELHAETRTAFLSGIGVGFPSSRAVMAPVERTDYLTTNRTEWTEKTSAGRWSESGHEYAVPRVYRPYEQVRRTWWDAIARPAIPAVGGAEADGLPAARFEDAIRVAIPQHVNGDRTVYGWSDQRGDSTTLVLRRDGREIGTANWSVAQFAVAPSTGWYELDLAVKRAPDTWATTSTATRTKWRFRSGHSTRARVVLPLVQVDYRLQTDAQNRVPAKGGTRLDVRASYQPGATGPGLFRTVVEVSHDGGKTWTKVIGSRLPAAPANAKAADLRVTATDLLGNSVTQHITRAYHLS